MKKYGGGVENRIRIGPSMDRPLNWFQSRHPSIANSGFNGGITNM